MNTLILYNDKKCIEISYHKDNITESDANELAINYGMNKVCKNIGFTLLDSEKTTDYNYGQNMLKIGTDSFCDIVLENREKVLIVIEEGILRTIYGKAYVNGALCIFEKNTIHDGDTIFIPGIKIDYYSDHISITGNTLEIKLIQSLNINPYRKLGMEYRRSPRIYMEIPTESVEVKKPPSKPAKDRNAILKRIAAPFLTLAITVGVGILLKRGIFILMSAGMMVATIIVSIVTGIQSTKDRKEQEEERVNNYNKYLLNRRGILSGLRKKQIESLRFNYPDIRCIELLCDKYSNRIYERDSNDADFLNISVGTSDMSPSFKIKYEENMDNAGETLYEEMQELGKTFSTIENLPYIIDLKKTHLGLIGERKYIYEIQKAIVSELCFFHSYHDMEIILITNDFGIKQLSDLFWYPHFRLHGVNVSTLISTGNHAELVLASLTTILKERKLRTEEERKDVKFLPHFVLILDEPSLVVNHSVMEYLQMNGERLGFSLIYSARKQESLPDYIKTVIKVDGNEYAKIVLNQNFLMDKDIKLYDMKNIDMEKQARRLAALKHVKGVFSQIPESISFFEMFNINILDDLNIKERWKSAAVYKSMATPIGVRAKDDIVFLNLHEKAHGPHGLVAGTTGSGKSEILQTLILSLSVNFSPEDIGFLLIDYKGGGMANLFKDLPHLLGTITNLDGSESMRALVSIKSELGRRQRVFNEAGVNNINEYTKLYKAGKVIIPLPHLLLISDEFAELKHEQPEFMAELVSASRIGRSLGVHLILATQKPSGIVDDQIWSNSKFKLALKVQDAADSKEVIKTPDAAQITNPGRAYLQVGNNEVYELFQSAFSGAYFDEETEGEGFDKRIYRINELGQKELISDDRNIVESKATTTQLAAVVDYIQSIYQEEEHVFIDRTWLPPLSEVMINPHINIDMIKNQVVYSDMSADIGVVDMPENQSQMEFSHNFLVEGNIVIFGSQGVGKSVFLTNIAMSLSLKNRTENLHYYILDFGNSSLIQLKDLPQTADYISFEDEEKLTKLVKLLEDEIKLRKRLFAKRNAISFSNYNEKSTEKLPAIIIFIDNYDVVKELSIDLEGFINKLSRDGAGIGIYMAVSATRQGAIRYSILNNFKNKIAGYLFDKTDVLGIVGRSKYQLPEIKGRALIKLDEVNIMQCYTPVELENYTENIDAIIEELSLANLGNKPEGIKVMPETVTADMVWSDSIDKPGIGLDTDEIETQCLELSGNIHMIVGKEGTGKTNVLKLILEQLKEAEVYICDSVGSELGREYKDMAKFYFNNEADAGIFYKLLEDEVNLRVNEYERVKHDKSLREFCMELTQVVIVIDDIERFINLCKDIRSDLEKLIPKLLDYGISIVEAVTPNELRGFDDLTKKLKDINSGVVLGIPDEQSFIRMPVIRNYKFVIGTGFVFKGGDIKKVRIPLI